MPELPEITLYKKYVDSTSLHQKIVEVKSVDKSLLQGSEEDFEKALTGNELQESQRFGKYLLLKTKKDKWLVFHFGMTGKLEYYSNQEPPKYSRMTLSFENGYHLAFVCRRKLGKIYLTSGIDQFKEEKSLGNDALEMSREEWEKILARKKGSIKGALTDQSVISGIGNVYADEVLYQCNIHPKTKVEALTKEENAVLYEKIKTVLETAINNEGLRSELPDSYLTPHRKEGADCPKCSGEITMIKVSGRSTYFCPSCQKQKS